MEGLGLPSPLLGESAISQTTPNPRHAIGYLAYLKNWKTCFIISLAWVTLKISSELL
jgi:hypothetical protein